MASEAVAELRHLNSLVYSRPSSGSLLSERQHRLSFPASLTYTMGSTIAFICNSGEASVWGPSSYLKLKFEFTKTAAVTINDSWYSLFSAARLYHRSGELLENVPIGSDVLSAIKLRYNTSFSDYQKLKTLIGGADVVGGAAKADIPTTPDANGAVTAYANLPLSILFGVFDNKSQYICPELIAGARVELVLNPSFVSMGGVTGITENTFKVSPVMALDCGMVFSEARKQLLEESSDVQASGLQFTYSTYFVSQSQVAVGSLNVDVLQSASLTEKAFLVLTTDSEANKYNFKPLNEDGAFAMQWRLGSCYLPIYQLQNNNECFMYTQIAFNGAYNQYAEVPSHTGVAVTSFGTKNCVYATSLEKSASGCTLSGSPTNNSRLININCSGSVSGVATVFLQYVRVANCMLDSCVVDR